MSEWMPHTKIDFSDLSIMQYHIDTRDFHCNTNIEPNKEIDISKISKYPDRFFFTPSEVVSLIDRLYTESGGGINWRMLELNGDGAKYTGGWQIKYIRIHRTPLGLIVCNRDNYAMRKEIWECNAYNNQG